MAFNSLSPLLVYALIFFVIFRFKRVMSFALFSKMRLRSAGWEPSSRAQAPAHTQHLLACAQQELELLGFERIGCMQKPPIVFQDPRAATYSDLYWQPEHACIARAEPAGPSTGKALSIQFLNVFQDGGGLLTVNRERHQNPPYPPALQVLDPYTDNLTKQWTAHLDALAQLSASRACETERAAVVARSQDWDPPQLARYWQAIGWAEAAAENTCRLTLKGAWRLSGMSASPPAAARLAVKQPYSNPPLLGHKAVAMTEMELVASQVALNAVPLPMRLKAAAFGITLVLGSLAFGSQLGGAGLAALMLSLLVHETGHWLAMRRFGYRNLSIFFLPFFGAATVGHKPHATPMQEVWVALAGPLTGLLAAALAYALPADAVPDPLLAFARQFALLSVILNLFNLLPFGILDGGKVFEHAVLARFPYARALFKALGAIAGLVFAVSTRSVMLGLFMAILLFNTPRDFAAAGLLKRIRAKAQRAGIRQFTGPQALLAVGDALSDERFHKPGQAAMTTRILIARTLYPALQKTVPGLGTALGGLGLLGASFFVPLILVGAVWLGPIGAPLLKTTPAEAQEQKAVIARLEAQQARSPETQKARTQLQQLKARYAAETDVTAKWKLLDDYTRDQDVEDLAAVALTPELGEWIEHERTALLPQLPPDHVARLQDRLEHAEAALETAPAAGLSALEALTGDLTANGQRTLDQIDSPHLAVLADIYQTWVRKGTPEQVQRHQAAIDALWTEIAARQDIEPLTKAQFALVVARADFTTGHAYEADRRMRDYVDFSPKEDKSSASDATLPGRDYAEQQYAWFLIDANRPDDALELANQADRAPADRAEWLVIAGWAALSKNQAQAAEHSFQAAIAEREKLMNATPLPWWLRLLTHRMATSHLRDLAELDRIVAVQRTDPGAAQQLIARIENPSAYQRSLQRLDDAYWSRRRAAALRAILTDALARPADPTRAP